MQSRCQTSGQDDAKLKCGASLDYNLFNKTQEREFVYHVAFHKSLNSDKQDVRYVSPVTEEREECITNSKKGDVGVLSTWNIFVAFFTSFWTRLRLHVALELLGDPSLYCGPQHFYSSSWRSRSTPQRFLSEFKDELNAGDHSVEFVSLGPKN